MNRFLMPSHTRIVRPFAVALLTCIISTAPLAAEADEFSDTLQDIQQR